MPLSAAERAKRYRDKIKSDPAKHEEYIQNERDRYKARRNRGDVDLSQKTEREGRQIRRTWQETKRRAKKSKHMLVREFQFMTANSPMTSPEHSTENEPNVTPQSRRGRKKMRRDRSKAYRKIAQLEKSIKEKERVIARYKKRMQRDRKRKEKVKGSKAVLLHNVLLQGIKSRMNEQIDVVGQLMPTEELKRNKLARTYSRET